jgi:hypothetical protein
MEEHGEQCTVVFAFIVTEPASECVCGGMGGSRLAGSVAIYGKTTMHCSPDSSVLLGNSELQKGIGEKV